MKTCKIPFSKLNLSKKDVLEEMGYEKISPNNSVLNVLDELYTLLEDEVVTEYTFRILEGKIAEESIIFDNIRLNTGSIITPLLKGSSTFAFFAATAGERFEQIMQNTKAEEDMLKTFLLDSIGSCIPEKAGEFMKQHIMRETEGFQHTNGFSPGYCGWSLTEQQTIFAVLGGNPCGITLTDSCLMIPIKSISGIIGIGHRVNQKAYGCSFCELETCYKRNKIKI